MRAMLHTSAMLRSSLALSGTSASVAPLLHGGGDSLRRNECALAFSGLLQQRRFFSGQSEYTSDSGSTTAIMLKTSCGRTFDSTLYRQATRAMEDQRWVEAIQQSLLSDKEYVEALRERGGVSKRLRELAGEHSGGRDASSEAAFLEALRVELLRDAHLSLCVCALQDAYVRIRRRRDEEKARRVAESSAAGDADPMAFFKKNEPQYGARKPPVF